MRHEPQSIVKAFSSQDGREARRAFIEKRAPMFEGRQGGGDTLASFGNAAYALEALLLA